MKSLPKSIALATAMLAASPVAAPAQSLETIASAGWRTISLDDSRRVAAQPRMVASLSGVATRASVAAIEAESRGFVAPEEIWLTVIDARDPHDPRIGSYQGEQSVYPASVIKLCYMAIAFDQLATGRLAVDDGMASDLSLMIGHSDNKATNRVLDRVTNTGFGPSLEGDARESFTHKRGTVNRYFADLGLPSMVASNKTYSGDIPLYGRDVDFLGNRKGDNFENSNMMSTNDTARLLYLIHQRALVSRDASEQMLNLMRRDGDRPKTYLTRELPDGVRAYSKDGSTSINRNDAVIYELPEGGAIIIVAFTKPRGATRDAGPVKVIEHAATMVLQELRATLGSLDQASQEFHE